MVNFDPNSDGIKKDVRSSILERLNAKTNKIVTDRLSAKEVNDSSNNSIINCDVKTIKSEPLKKIEKTLNNENNTKRKRKRSIDGYVSDTNSKSKSLKSNHIVQNSETSIDTSQQPIKSSPVSLKKNISILIGNEGTSLERDTDGSLDTSKLKIRNDLMKNLNNGETELISVKSDTCKTEKYKDSSELRKKKSAKNKRQLKKDLEFMKLGSSAISNLTKVCRILPYWLQNPYPVANLVPDNCCPLGNLHYLKKELKKVLVQDNVKTFFPVQRAVIPEIIAQADAPFTGCRSSDLCVSAATGSGKTLAYVLPVLHVLSSMAPLHVIRALVILPTEQLATQITRVFKHYGASVGVRVGSAIGCTNFQQEQRQLVARLEDWQMDSVNAGACGVTGMGGSDVTHKSLVNVLVATPDRLKDHMMLTPGFSLARLKYLIFDEADRLMSGDGGQWVRSITKTIEGQQMEAALTDCGGDDAVMHGYPYLAHAVTYQAPAHKLLISATLSCDPEKLGSLDLHDPILFTTTAADPGAAYKRVPSTLAAKNAPPNRAVAALGSARPATLSECYMIVQQSVQPLVLYNLITTKNWRRVLVFVQTKNTCHRLALVLQALAQEEFVVGEFSSKLGSWQKKMAGNFAKGWINVLVSTDSLSRGIDFEGVEVVVNYDATECNETYVHRVGRTARAGNEGLALTMLTKKVRRSKFIAMLKQSGSGTVKNMKVDWSELHLLEQRYKDALATSKKTIDSESKTSARAVQKKHAVGITVNKARIVNS